jgi:hypothetical protein
MVLTPDPSFFLHMIHICMHDEPCIHRRTQPRNLGRL